MNPLRALRDTHFQFPGQRSVYHGKVRDVYTIGEDLLVMVASDRISAFDVILPRAIPWKGQVLNQLASHMLDATADVAPNWKIATPDPNVTIGWRCEPFKVEMVIRGYLTGHAWRVYREGGRELCGVKLPEGLREHDRLPEPIITPTTKADSGHDQDISRKDILSTGLVGEGDYIQMERYTRELYHRGTTLAATRGLILVDTKYEFGKRQDAVILMDELHTPDSSRYFYQDGYEERQQLGQGQRQLSKEFVREWLIEGGFMGRTNERVPEMTDPFVTEVSQRYIELYEMVTGLDFAPADYTHAEERISLSVKECLESL